MPAARHDRQRGQASVELIALVPVLIALALGLWQSIVAGQAAWLAGGAARAAARAQALGGDPIRAARSRLPHALQAGLRVSVGDDDAVAVRVVIPMVVGGGSLAAVSARARMAPQR